MGYLSVFINAIIVLLMAMYVYENESRHGEISSRFVLLGLEGDKKLSTLEEKLDRLKLDSEEEKKAIQVKINDMEKLISTKAGIEKMANIEKQLKAQEKAVNKIIICERNSAFISCNSQISIVEAIYGRQTDTSICPTLVKTSNCRSPASDGKVNSQCNGKSICELTATNHQFGDPCPGVVKLGH
ncbi:unnamed protein product [Mytilus edulis]|uniref:SUEL-type lectin domain-containing protein n=1 Tax=Mytilus edulis TaxID=6550 RepID=A0A8S3TNK2_MYTED|nr:unnamed protein product [Mytilus edulis]